MREAQTEADQGKKALYDGRDLDKDVLPHYNQAIKLRPYDWVYYNERGIAYLEKWNDPDYKKSAAIDFYDAREATNNKPSEIIKMYNYRADSLKKMIKHHSDVDHAVPKVFYTELSNSYAELYAMTADSHYKVLQNEVDAQLQQYQ
jgi:hypothetical protein